MDIEDIELLCTLHFTWTQISEILGVSRLTIYKKLKEYGISMHTTYTNITNEELDQQVGAIKVAHPNDGERLIIGHLRACGIFVSRSRIRAAIHRTDPLNVYIRRMVTVRRRVYFAGGPNSVWHLDGHHKRALLLVEVLTNSHIQLCT